MMARILFSPFQWAFLFLGALLLVPSPHVEAQQPYGGAQRGLAAKQTAFRKETPLQDETHAPSTNVSSPYSCSHVFVLIELWFALVTMQEEYFETWVGTWPDAIDWTAAVLGTQVSATAAALSLSDCYEACPRLPDGLDENLINRYFAHTTAFYFGENAISLRTQAYDDMLWVVLGWLEGVRLVDAHAAAHYPPTIDPFSTWHGKQFAPAFAHRARVFWELARKGWDTTLCGGGMLWTPYLAPYKNAITNELWVAASVAMYLYFPGDDNASPFAAPASSNPQTKNGNDDAPPPGKPRDIKYLTAALQGYGWLTASNMTNGRGLYVDGFHVHGWENASAHGTARCDERNEAVYTYNQGVLLSAQRGLWLATGEPGYLADGHALVRSVVAATGWSLVSNTANATWRWQGLGRRGVLEEACDARGDCSQNGHAFKGIFFHHLAAFCAPLPTDEGRVGDPNVAILHRRRCREYTAWVQHNAEAAAGTRDIKGRFGMWWTPGLNRSESWTAAESPEVEGTDYRNRGMQGRREWTGPTRPHAEVPGSDVFDEAIQRMRKGDRVQTRDKDEDDPNERGRGRTVETQSGGVAVMRALYVFKSLGPDDW